MNKGLVLKIALGLIVVAIPVSMLLNSKSQDKSMEEVPQISQEDNEILDDLYSDTFNGNNDLDYNDEYLDESLEVIEDFEDYELDSNAEENKNNEISGETKSVTGEFQGFADGNFIEVKIGNEYSVFRVSNDVKSKIESKKIGDVISFTYVASAGQQVITSVN